MHMYVVYLYVTLYITIRNVAEALRSNCDISSLLRGFERRIQFNTLVPFSCPSHITTRNP